MNLKTMCSLYDVSLYDFIGCAYFYAEYYGDLLIDTKMKNYLWTNSLKTSDTKTLHQVRLFSKIYRSSLHPFKDEIEFRRTLQVEESVQACPRKSYYMYHTLMHYQKLTFDQLAKTKGVPSKY